MKSENAITFSAPPGMYPDVFAAKMTISGTEIFQQHEQLFPTFHGKPRLDQFAVGLPQRCKLNVRYDRCFTQSRIQHRNAAVSCAEGEVFRLRHGRRRFLRRFGALRSAQIRNGIGCAERRRCKQQAASGNSVSESQCFSSLQKRNTRGFARSGRAISPVFHSLEAISRSYFPQRPSFPTRSCKKTRKLLQKRCSFLPICAIIYPAKKSSPFCSACSDIRAGLRAVLFSSAHERTTSFYDKFFSLVILNLYLAY